MLVNLLFGSCLPNTLPLRKSSQFASSCPQKGTKRRVIGLVHWRSSKSFNKFLSSTAAGH